jgi:EAL domain-containing protein (putative c-di-GMP-specific phosphodiesterase class I)
VQWQQAGLPPVRVAVNLSPRQLSDPELVDAVRNVLADTGLKPDLLELEVTESSVMHNVERALEVLSALKKMGVRLAIDDFGTGYSSLAQLKRFPIDTLKVDRSFIRELPADSEDKAIAEAIIAMGRTLNLTVVAEGVETLEQQEFLRGRACDQMQGFFFSKPVPAADFAELLRAHKA